MDRAKQSGAEVDGWIFPSMLPPPLTLPVPGPARRPATSNELSPPGAPLPSPSPPALDSRRLKIRLGSADSILLLRLA
ncbi:hypothetical protein GQ55_2G004100 [Panicum hallii var. hallii]|uniref:Uncharacterized protein n=1 Tax=Panicum hallii var. hallii TaxID=1504633 RepID=A0A2T7EK26_9POAL|nr:hypothetical protein GQ55_2G004100 [Panicum hallii var. hallii]